MSKYLSIAEVADLLGIDSGKVHAWVADGILEAVNVTRVRGVRARWRISEAALNRFLAERSNQHTTPPHAVPRPRRQSAEAVTKYF